MGNRWGRNFTNDLTKVLQLFLSAPIWEQALSQEQHLIVPILEGTVGGSDGGGSLPTWGAAPANERLELEELLLSLPRNLHWDKDRKRQEEKAVTAEGAARSSRRPIALDVLAEGDEDGDGHDDDDDSPPAPAVDDDEGLVVAWQYRASVQRERLATGAQTRSTASAGSGSRSVFCHSYDLSGRMADQILIDPKANVVPLLSSSSSSSGGSEATDSMQGRGMDLFRDLVAVLKERATTAPEQGTAIRLLLYHPSMDSLAVALPLLLAHIRNEGLPVVVMVCTRPSQDVRSWIQLARTSDIVLRTEGFASRKEYPPPAEFRHLQGVLNVDKTTRKPTEIAALIYGFKRDRRKLHIQLLHIPPEDYAEGGGSVGAGGVRSGAGRPASTADEAHGTRTTPKTKPSGMGCSANFSGSALDF